jgi:thioredoxin-related protein
MKISNLKNTILCIGISFVMIISWVHGSFASNHIIENKKKDTLLIFTGSDWCLPCMQLEKNILSDSLFIQFISHNIELIQADFPQKKKLEANEISRNEKLAELYNPKGLFPYIAVLINGLPTRIPYHNQQPEELIKSIQHILQGYE